MRGAGGGQACCPRVPVRALARFGFNERGRFSMKIAIIGAGAIGGYVGVKLALAGEDVTFIVRGANLQAIRENGIKLVMQDGSEHVARNVRATNDYDEAGPQDMVVLGMKAHQVIDVVEQVPKLFGPDTV